MYYSDDIIDEVRNRNDIVDVIGGYISLNHKGSSYSACCPFHHEKTPSFHVNKEKQIFHCFGCGVGGNVYTFVMEYENMSFPEAIKLLADRVNYVLPEREKTKEEKQRENYKVMLKEMNKTAAIYYNYLLCKTERGKKAREYLFQRGISEKTIQDFGIGYSDIYENDLYQYLKKKGYSDKQMQGSGLVEIKEGKGGVDKFWNRVMVPILDINGKVIAFGGRVIGDGLPKYINTKETAIFDKSHTLFAMNLARRTKRRGMIVCEGYMDAISLHEAGFDNTVASLGTAFTIGHANIIKRYTEEVYLAYDSDEAGTKAALRAIDILRASGLIARVIDMSPYKDPDEFIRGLGAEAFEERIKNAVTGIVYEIDTIAGRFNMKDPEEKIKFSKEAARRIAMLEDPIARKSYIDTIASMYDIDSEGFKQAVNKYGTLVVNENLANNKEIYESKNEDRFNSNKVDKTAKPHRLLLTWMVNDTSLFESLKGVISQEDFVDEEYRLIADMLFAQYNSTGKVEPAAIIDKFEDVDEQKLAANIMQTKLQFDIKSEEMEKAVNEVVKKIKLERIDYELTKCNKDLTRFQSLIMEKAKISKMYIKL